MAQFGPLDNPNAIRTALSTLQTQIQLLQADAIITHNNVQKIQSEDIDKRLLTLGVRVAVVTEQIEPAISLTELGAGRIRLTNRFLVEDDREDTDAIFNISDQVYLVGSRVCVFQFMDSYFVVSDSGVDVEAVLPDVSISVAPGDTFFEWTEDAAFDLLGSTYFFLSDAEDVGGEYTLTFDVIDGVFAFTEGDSGVTQTSTNSSRIHLHGTLTELQDLVTGTTTATFTVTPSVPGTDEITVTLVEDITFRTGEDSVGILISAPAAGDNLQIDIYTSDDTWTKPAGAVRVHVQAIGGGGSGGSGRKGAAGSNRGGGGAGGGGRYTEGWFAAGELTSTVVMQVGLGNTTPGATQTTNSTNGNAGNAGEDSTFGAFLRALGGTAGVGGTDLGSGGSSLVAVEGGSAFDGGAAFSTFAGVSGGVSSSKYGGAAGGLGGGIAGTTPVAGVAGGFGNLYAKNDGADGGTLGAAPAGAGGNGTAGPSSTMSGGGGGGGGGGAANTVGTTAGGTGGNGAVYGGGGGGGGAATNSLNNSGPGGNGADGIVIVTTYF